MTPAGRLDVGIVGAGRVGAVLGAALRGVQHRVIAASAGSEESRERADALLPGVPVLDVPDVVARAQLVLLAVPDDELGPLVAGLAATGGFRPGMLVAHTAGRHGCEVLAPAVEAGAIALAMHPAMTFTGTSLDLARLHECPWAVTAAAPMLPIAQALVVELGGEPVVLEESARVTYHAALTHGANHLVTLVSQSLRVLRALGIEDPGLVLGPLLRAGLDGALRSGEALATGPVVRGDAGTIAAHLEALDALARDVRSPDGPPAGVPDGPPGAAAGVEDGPASPAALDDVPDAYRALATAAAQRAWTNGRLTRAQAQRVLAALETPR